MSFETGMAIVATGVGVMFFALALLIIVFSIQVFIDWWH